MDIGAAPDMAVRRLSHQSEQEAGRPQESLDVDLFRTISMWLTEKPGEGCPAEVAGTGPMVGCRTHGCERVGHLRMVHLLCMELLERVADRWN
jgi:hypothetical protein